MKNTTDKTIRKYQRGTCDKGKIKIVVSSRRQFRLIIQATKKLVKSGFKPDLIIGIATGGLYAALIARALGVPYGIWMAQGYDYKEEKKGKVGKRQRGTWFSQEIAILRRGRSVARQGKSIRLCHRLLLVDDLDDTGKTFHKAVNLLRQWYGYDFDIRTLALWHKKSSSFWVDYVAEVVPEDPKTGQYPWIVQAPEQWTEELKEDIIKYKKKFLNLKK